MSLSDLPLASGRQHMKAFQGLGWTVRREAEHIVMTHPDKFGAIVSIPNHKEVRRGTLHSILKGAGYSDKMYRAVFDAT